MTPSSKFSPSSADMFASNKETLLSDCILILFEWWECSFSLGSSSSWSYVYSKTWSLSSSNDIVMFSLS